MDTDQITEPVLQSSSKSCGGPAGNTGSSKGKHEKRRMAAVCILIFLFASGLIIDESDFLGYHHTSAVQYLEVYSAFLLLLVYIVPFAFFMKKLCARCAMSGLELCAAVFCGAFIPAALAGEWNGSFSDWMTALMGDSYSDAWLGSAQTGISEELLKLVTTALLLVVLNRKTLKQYLMTGMCVGMGFQIEEDMSYITDSGFKNVNDAFPTALDRISGALGSHWAYAAVTAAGLYLIVRADDRHHRRNGICWILLVMADHFLYDTPLGDSLLVNAILTVIVVLPVFLFFRRPEMPAKDV